MRTIRLGMSIMAVVLSLGSLYAQELVKNATAEGVTPLGSYRFGTIDTVNLQNGNLILEIPLLSIDGRGIDVSLSLIYNSKIWRWRDPIKPGLPPSMVLIPQRYEGLPVGWQLSIPKMRYRNLKTSYDNTYTEYTLAENGAAHNFTNELKIDTKGKIIKHLQKGYSFNSTYMTFNIPNSSPTNYIVKRDGTAIFFRGLFGRPERYPLKMKDRNGNFLSFFLGSEEGFTGDVANLITSIEDTLGRRIRFHYDDTARLSSIEYTDANGLTRNISFQYGTARIEWDGNDWGAPHQNISYDTTVLSKVILPNGLEYEFGYDLDLNQGRGQVTSAILPTGGTLRYTYGKARFPGDLLTDVAATREEIEGQTSNSWQYQYDVSELNPPPGSYPLTTSVIDPLGNQVEHTFMNTTTDGDMVEAKREIFQGSGEAAPLIRKINLSWDTNDNFPGPVSSSISAAGVCVNPRVIQETTTLYDTSPPEGQSISYNYRLNANPRYCPDGNPIEIRHRKFSGEIYIPENAVLLKKTVREYYHTTNPVYYNHNLLDLLSKETTLDASDTAVSERNYGYDNFSLATATTIHHETPLNGNYRGNLTRTITKLFSGTDVVTESYYDSFGNVIKSKDGKNNETAYAYTSNYKFAYPEAVTNPMGHQALFTYSFHTGALLHYTDANSNITEHVFDMMGRLTEIRNPDGGGSIYTYNDTLPLSITTSTKLSASQSLVSHISYDGFGRQRLTRTVDPEGDVLVETFYDALGRISKESYPYRSGESPSFSVYQYDAFGRILKVTYPDDNFIQYQYSGYLTKAFDQTGRWRELTYDPLGNLMSVNENGLNTTQYSHDVLGNLLQVIQGDRVRTFAYDSLGRLTSETHPESGTAGYVYDSNSNITRKTDSRAIVTDGSYDALDRVAAKSYSDGTPAVTYFYDGANPIGLTSQNPKGRLTGISTQRLKEAYSYDKIGRLIKEAKEIDGQRFEISYAYDLAGNIVSEIYPSGRIVSKEISTAGRVTRLRDETRARDIISGIIYAPYGAINQKIYGNGLINTISFNNRLQPARIKHGNVLDLSYDHYDSNAKNNGNVIGITDNLHAEKSTNYAYDALNRLTSAVTSTWSQSFNYDIFGNMLSKLGTGGAPTASFAYNQKNQIIGLNYDPTGNLLSDGTPSFNYDANNQIKETGIYAYIYDAEGKRVIKEKNVVPKEIKYYIYNQSGLPIAEYLKTGSGPICWKKDIIYLGLSIVQSADNPANQTCSLPPSDLVYYYHQDHLGNTRIITDQNGNIAETHDFYPFGEKIATQPQSEDKFLFTGKPRDAETGIDYFGVRYYSSTLSRWLSPENHIDLLANMATPQRWNLYVYVLNNPINLLDLEGNSDRISFFIVVDPAAENREKGLAKQLATRLSKEIDFHKTSSLQQEYYLRGEATSISFQKELEKSSMVAFLGHSHSEDGLVIGLRFHDTILDSKVNSKANILFFAACKTTADNSKIAELYGISKDTKGSALIGFSGSPKTGYMAGALQLFSRFIAQGDSVKEAVRKTNEFLINAVKKKTTRKGEEQQVFLLIIIGDPDVRLSR